MPKSLKCWGYSRESTTNKQNKLKKKKTALLCFMELIFYGERQIRKKSKEINNSGAPCNNGIYVLALSTQPH